MKKVAVVYWSGTGNTEQMAHAVVAGIEAQGSEAKLFKANEFNKDLIADFDGIAFGCSAMGDEVLEESEFEPMFSSCKEALKNKEIVLFGSFDWGDGQWMRDWEETCKNIGAIIVAPYVICQDAPDTSAVEACNNLGGSIA